MAVWMAAALPVAARVGCCSLCRWTAVSRRKPKDAPKMEYASPSERASPGFSGCSQARSP